MTVETLAGTNRSLKDILPVHTLSRMFRITIPFVDKQELHPEDAVKVAIATVWQENPDRAENDIASLGLSRSLKSVISEVLTDPILCDAFEQVVNRLQSTSARKDFKKAV